MIPVLRPYHDGTDIWDQALLNAALAGKLWPLPCEFGDGAPDGGAVVMAHGPLVLAHGGSAALRPHLERLSWALLLHTSDEEQTWDSDPARRDDVWLQYADPTKPRAGRPVLLGWPPDARRLLGESANFGSGGRSLCGFAGQTQNDSRRELVSVLGKRTDGRLEVSDGFAQGLDRAAYFEMMARTAIAPCPMGNASPDTLRLYEALEAGCLPITERRMPGWPDGFDYFATVNGDEFGAEPIPWPRVNSWSELPAILDRYADDLGGLQREMTRCLAWWIGYKRRITLDLIDDCRRLGASIPVPPITVLIPTSPIAAHPSTAMVEECIRRVRAYLPTADIILMIDGVRPEQAERQNVYDEYKRVLVDFCNDAAGIYPLIFREFTHQATMMRRALDFVRTPLVFFVEHDTWPVGRIDFPAICRAFENAPGMKMLRLHYDVTIHPEHRAFMQSSHPVDMGGIAVYRTCQWSQRPHVARTAYYRKLIRDNFAPESRSMIEDVVYGAVVNSAGVNDRWEEHGVCVYAPEEPEGNIKRSDTCDGRGEDEKYPMLVVSADRSQRYELAGCPGKK